MVDAIVPQGMSDDQIRAYAKIKRPDVFAGGLPVKTSSLSDVLPRVGLADKAASVASTAAGGFKQMGQSVYDVSAPNIATQMYKRFKGQPNTLSRIPMQAAAMMGGMMSGAPPEQTSAQQPSLPASTPQTIDAEPPSQNVPLGKLPKETGDPYTGRNVPKMELVDSTNITKAGYHPDSQTMMVEFRNGRVYRYKGVPQEIFDKFKDSESQGSFLSRNIKGRYTTEYRGSVLGKR